MHAVKNTYFGSVTSVRLPTCCSLQLLNQLRQMVPQEWEFCSFNLIPKYTLSLILSTTAFTDLGPISAVSSYFFAY